MGMHDIGEQITKLIDDFHKAADMVAQPLVELIDRGGAVKRKEYAEFVETVIHAQTLFNKALEKAVVIISNTGDGK